MPGSAPTGIRTKIQVISLKYSGENCCMREQFSTMDSVKNAAISLAVTALHLYATGLRVWGERDNHYTTETVKGWVLSSRGTWSICAHWPLDVSSIAWPHPDISNTGHHLREASGMAKKEERKRWYKIRRDKHSCRNIRDISVTCQWRLSLEKRQNQWFQQ